MNLTDSFATYLPLIEAEMRDLLQSPDGSLDEHYGIMQYHMGWLDAGLRPVAENTGKRIRPVLCLLACAASGGDPNRALPAAAGLELLHNFSLLHDDIEDGSALRRHRPTAWTVFGLPLALNAGDAMFSLAHLAFQRLPDRQVPITTALEALRIFDRMCVALTEGQFLDMSFEKRSDVQIHDYFRMIQGKTGMLLGASAQIGALIGGASPAVIAAFRRYGQALGMAFQLKDDVLGIWGAEEVTGKSAASDILSKKKSLPVLFALADPQSGAELAARYAGPDFAEDDVEYVLSVLDRVGARAFTETRAREATIESHQSLYDAVPDLPAEAQAPLHELLDLLLEREA